MTTPPSSSVGGPTLSLLVVTTSQAGPLAEALDSIAAHLPPEVDRETIVVLSGASPEVREVVASRREPLVVVASPVNLGVAGGYNRARSAARGRWLALVHDDVRIEPGWFGPLAETLLEHPEAGAVASLVLDPDGSLQSAGSLVWREGWTTVPWPAAEPPDPEAFVEVEPIDYGGTAAIVVRREVFDAVGGLDEELHPAYYVDVDLCLSIRQLGRTVLLQPASRVRHRRSSSTTARFREFLVLRNRQRMLRKWAAELAERPSVDLTPEGLARARERVRAEAAAIAREDASAPSPLPSRFSLDVEAQQLRLARLGAEIRRAYRIWETSAAEEPVTIL